MQRLMVSFPITLTKIYITSSRTSSDPIEVHKDANGSLYVFAICSLPQNGKKLSYFFSNRVLQD